MLQPSDALSREERDEYTQRKQTQDDGVDRKLCQAQRKKQLNAAKG